jgi:plastocyanin
MGDFMTKNPTRAFVRLRLRTFLCFLLFMATGVTLIIPTRSALARPTPTPRPRATPCEHLPPPVLNVTVGQGLAFVPNTLYATEGQTVCWNWASNGHSVTSGINCTANGWFCSPDNMNCSQGILSNNGTQYCVTFVSAGFYYYFCAAHCAMGMTGLIYVAPKPRWGNCP